MAGLGNSGQTLNDRLNAARYALAGQGLARVVCKATTEEMIAPKKKHIDYLLQCTNEPNVSIPQLANLLIERTAHPNWVVVFKSLVTVHHLMCYGNERFTQYLASSNSNFQLSNYQDKSSNRGYDMSMFIRRYAKYLNTKALSYRTVAFDFTKIKRGGDGQLRAMNVEKLVKTVPMLQTQIDSLLEFDCNASDLTNGVINAAFFLLFKDLIRLFACYNDGIINCLEKYFEMTNKKMARETLEIYKKFLIRMNKVGDFLKTAENVGIDKGEIPDLTKAPSSLLDAMEQHLAQLEGKKPGTTTSTSNGENTEVSAKKAIEEEEQFLNKLKAESAGDSEKHVAEKKPSSGGATAPVSNPFLAMTASPTADSSKGAKSSDIIDLFGSDEASGRAAAVVSKSPAEDLFSLSSGPAVPATGEAASSNPFADILNSMGPLPGQTVPTATAVPGNSFATSDNFAAAFGSSSTSNLANSTIPKEETRSPTQGFDAFGDVLQPMNVSSLSAGPQTTTTPAVPIITTPVPSSVSSQSLLKGDLDASLASLAQNLDINGPKGAGFKKSQFNQSPKSMMKTGTPMVSSTSTPAISSTAGMWSMPMAAGTGMPVASTGLGWAGNQASGVGAPVGGNINWTAAGAVANPPMMPIMGTLHGQSSAMVMPSVSPSMPLGFGMRPPNMIPGAVSVLPAGVTPATLSSALNSRLNSTGTNSTAPTSTLTSQQVSDPFGAL